MFQLYTLHNTASYTLRIGMRDQCQTFVATCVVSSYSFDLPEGESVESGVEYFVSIIHKFTKGQPCPTSSAANPSICNLA